MKKKIIGIILTLTMVLTLLPAFALPTKADSAVTKAWEIKKANGEYAKQGSDGEYDCKTDENGFTYVDIGSSDLVISGVLVGSIRLNRSVTKVTFKNLKILPDDKYYMDNPAVFSYSETVEIVLEGKNYIGESSEDKNIFPRGIEGQNLTFSGNGNLDIYSLDAAISVHTIWDNESEGEEEGKNLTFNLQGDGKVKVVQCESPQAIREKREESAPKGERTVSAPLDSIIGASKAVGHFIDGTIYADGDINIKDGKLEVINNLSGERFYKEGRFRVFAGLAAEGDINISTAKTVSVKSYYGIAAAALGDVTIDKNVKDLILYGSLEEELMSLGALASAGTITNNSGNKLLGGVVKGPDFTEKDLGTVKEEKISLAKKIEELEKNKNLEEANVEEGSVDSETAEAPKVIEEQVENLPETTEVVEKPISFQATMVELSSLDESFSIVGESSKLDMTITTYTVDGEVANALMIKAPDKNPETEDTSAMLIWAFAGLAALAVAAGILVSRKQRD